MHPLTPNLSELTDQELQDKLIEIQNKIASAYRMGYTHIIQQLQMVYDDYLYENSKRQQKILEEMQQNFGSKINISK